MARSIFHDVSSLPWKGPSGVKVLETEADVLASYGSQSDESADSPSPAPAADPPPPPPQDDPPPPQDDPPQDDSSEDQSGSDPGSAPKGRRGRR